MHTKEMDGEDVIYLENILKDALQPVDPRLEFVNSLQNKVMTFSFPFVQLGNKKSTGDGLILLASLFIAILLIGVWIRLLIGIGKMIGMRKQEKRGSRKQGELSLPNDA
jgi:hypothetical protein